MGSKDVDCSRREASRGDDDKDQEGPRDVEPTGFLVCGGGPEEGRDRASYGGCRFHAISYSRQVEVSSGRY